jgi:predicted dehydrogenase
MRVLFLGLGGVGQRHLRNLRSLHPDAVVAAVRHAGRAFEIGNDLKPDHTVDIVARYGITCLPDLAAGIAWKPDFAVVATPSSLHVAQVSALIQAGIPVFVEKPLATSAEGLDALYALAKAQAVPVGVGYHLRFHPCVRRLRELLARDAVGKVQSLEVAVHSHMPSWHGYEKPNEFYAGVKALGGGVVLTEIHEIDLLCWMFGRPERVAAFGGRRSDLDIDVEDTISAILDFSGLSCALTLSFVQNPPMRRFVVNGSLGRIVMEIPRLSIVAWDEAGNEFDRLDKPDFDRNLMFVEELSAFISALDGAAPPVGLAQVRDGQDTALALLDALLSPNGAVCLEKLP